MGFSVTLLSSRVRWQRLRDYIPSRTHVFLRVEIGGDSWLADCGIGNLSLTGAIRLELDTEQATPHEPRRIVRNGDTYLHQVRFGADWHDVNDFTLEEMAPVDCEVANWFTSSHSDSKFRTRLFAARSAPESGRLTLNDNKFSLRDATGRAEKRLPTSRAELFPRARRIFWNFSRSRRASHPAVRHLADLMGLPFLPVRRFSKR